MSGKVKILILAGGKGKRMNSELPKALIQIRGESIIRHLLSSIKTSGVDARPTIVVGYGKEMLMKELGNDYEYVIQEEQKGTGHAVMVAETTLKNLPAQAGKTDHVMILYCDHPFVKPETIKNLIEKHIESEDTITLATVKLPDFEDWRSIFYENFSRLIRGQDGKIIRDVQFKDADEEEKKITEVNPCYFCFEASWLWSRLKTLSKNNAQQEYYLTDLIKIAMGEKERIGSVEIDPREALGANSKEELAILEKFAPEL
ncbi:MAG: NTP transferase domain-containing protein [bacterium]